MKTFLVAACTLAFTISSTAQTDMIAKKGSWLGYLTLNQNDQLPFNISISGSKSSPVFAIHNGKETIELKQMPANGDSVQMYFSTFNSALIFKAEKKKLTGYWVNYNKVNYRIPFHADYSKANRFQEEKVKSTTDFAGRWKTNFANGTPDEYPALGIFEQDGNSISGTFLTETGDYRFLDGNAYGDHFSLSCFDGSHAFLFKATISKEGQLNGTFFSGKHWQTTWVAERNATFELTNPDSLTYVTNEKDVFTFDLTDTKGNTFHYPNETYANKVVIIQLMGTWCPNCMDESIYFKSLYDRYHDQGLEIISVGYEISNDFSQQVKRIEQYKNRFQLSHLFLVGGQSNKNLAAEQFPLLNDVISFPTTIFIGRDGEIKRIHTGFNGPGTGSYYDEYVQKTDALIESLLHD